METSSFFGIYCFSIFIVSATSETANVQECSLENHFRCASLITDMENTLQTNRTCQALKESITCVKDLWNECGYDCTQEYKDYAYVSNYSCTVNAKIYQGPMNYNLKMKEHPCVILKNLEVCIDNCPPLSHPDGVHNLDRLNFSDIEIRQLREMKQCSNDVIEKYIKSYEHYRTQNLDIVACTEIKLSNRYFLEDLSLDAGTPQCTGSTVQQMVVDVIGAGINHYIQQCESVTCQASSLSNSIVAIFVVVICYTFSR